MELLSTEEIYVHDMKLIEDIYIVELVRKSIVTESQTSWYFKNIK
jgi:hypothetical protein